MARDLPPPHDLDAEAAVLSTLLLYPESLADVEPVCTPSEFYSTANRRVAEALWALDEAGESIDVATVAHRLRDSGHLDQVGGTPYLAQLSDATPSVAHVETHARIVSDLARVRAVQAVCAQVRAEAYGELGDVSEWIAGAEKRLLDATESRETGDTQTTIRDGVAIEHERLREPGGAADMLGLPTGIPGLDRILGGLLDGCQYVLAARPGVGKTALASQIVCHAAPTLAESGRAAFFASLEMPREQLVQRCLAQQSGVSLSAIRFKRIGPEDWQPLATAMSDFEHMPLVIDDKPAQGPHQIKSALRRAMRRLPGTPAPGLIVVDYLQLMTTPGGRGKRSREEEVASFSGALLSLAKEYRCPVIALSQLNRETSRQKRRPTLSDLRESGAIEQDAYGVIFLHKPDDEGLEREIVVAKHRNGSEGIVDARLMGDCVRLYEKEQSRGEEFDEFDDYGERMN